MQNRNKPGALAVAVGLGAALSLSLLVQTASAGAIKLAVKDDAIAKSLSGKKGNAKNGRKLAVNRKKGNCLACHVITKLKENPFHGNIGPSLDGVAGRYKEGELRLRVADAKLVNEDTIMPAYYRNTGFHRVMKKFQGKSVLSAQEVEDVVAFLMTLK